MKLIKIGLLPRVIIAIILGIVFGLYLPDWFGRIFVTFSGLFGNLLNFVVPLIILGLVTPAIAHLGSGAKKLLMLTVAIAYGSTLFSGFFTYLSCFEIFPKLLHTGTHTLPPDISGLKPFFSFEMPPVFSVTTALILSFILGLGLSVSKGHILKGAFSDFKDIIEGLITKVIIPLLPLHILGIFLDMSQAGHVASIIQTFIKIIAVIFALHVILLTLQYILAGIISRQNPLRLIRFMLPAYLTALGTSSSAATIPVTLRQAKRMGVNENIAGFVVPLCATIHLAGSMMKITSCAMALMIMTGRTAELSLDHYAPFIFMLGIAMVAAPGVPGGAIMAAIGVLGSMLNFDKEMQGYMIALYIAMDCFGTACNVTGDGAIATIVNRLSGFKMKPNPSAQ